MYVVYTALRAGILILQFIENFRLPASHHVNPSHSLHPNSTAWIYYGGSYAGARAAHMRTQYPHLIWGAIASSGQSLIDCLLRSLQ